MEADIRCVQGFIKDAAAVVSNVWSIVNGTNQTFFKHTSQDTSSATDSEATYFTAFAKFSAMNFATVNGAPPAPNWNTKPSLMMPAWSREFTS